jgi:hypothetical protein
MNETLRNTVEYDPGLAQFMNNYEHVTADNELRKEYNSYTQGLLYYYGVRRMAYEEGEEFAKLNDARRFLKIGLSPEQVAEGTELPIETVRELLENP